MFNVTTNAVLSSEVTLSHNFTEVKLVKFPFFDNVKEAFIKGDFESELDAVHVELFPVSYDLLKTYVITA